VHRDEQAAVPADPARLGTHGRGLDVSEKLLVNPIECEGHGACAELLPEMIHLDEWGYPIVDGRPVPAGLERDARAAVSACPTLPTLALRLLRS
jgi:ferredoxin